MSTAVENAPETDLPDHYEVVNGQVVELAPIAIMLPGFSVPMAELFPAVAEESPAANDE